MAIQAQHDVRNQIIQMVTLLLMFVKFFSRVLCWPVSIWCTVFLHSFCPCGLTLYEEYGTSMSGWAEPVEAPHSPYKVRPQKQNEYRKTNTLHTYRPDNTQPEHQHKITEKNYKSISKNALQPLHWWTPSEYVGKTRHKRRDT